MPTLIKKGILTFSCGDKHTLAIDKNYEVHSWGDNTYGQLGHGSSTFLNFNIPNHVLFLKNKTIVNVSAGSNHSVAVTIDGYAY